MRIKDKICREEGLGAIALIFLVGLAGAVVYFGYQIIGFYYYFYELQGQMVAQADKAQVTTDEEIRKTIWKTVKELDIPVDDPDLLKINRFNGKIVIQLEYDEVLFLDLGPDYSWDLHVFHFDAKAERVVN